MGYDPTVCGGLGGQAGDTEPEEASSDLDSTPTCLSWAAVPPAGLPEADVRAEEVTCWGSTGAGIFHCLVHRESLSRGI